MAKSLKYLSFRQLLKHIIIFTLGGQIQCLWVRPLWFSTLQLLIHLRSTNPWENTVVKSGELFSDIFDVHNGLWM